MLGQQASSKRPSVLLAATVRWPVAARLAIRFANAGCHVEIVCPRGNPALKTNAVARSHVYHPLIPLLSFRRAIQAAERNLVVPCDDLAAAHLHELYESDILSNGTPGPTASLLNRSLGAPQSHGLMTNRIRLMELARSEGIVVPKSAAVKSLRELQNWLLSSEFPVVLKADGTAAGIGVRMVRTDAEAERAFRKLSSPPASLRVLKRAMVDRDFTSVLPFIMRSRPSVTVQSFIPGRDATTSIACRKGKVLASNTFEVVRETKPNGPASVVRVIENPQISEASVKLIRRLHLSGLYGLDFRIDAQNVAYLLEMNPRATQSSHLNLGKGYDPVGELVAAMCGQKLVETKPATTNSVIALFPNEWQFNPTSEFLSSAYHDVPWGEPELVRVFMRTPSRLGKWSSSAGLAKIRSRIGWFGSSKGTGHENKRSRWYAVTKPRDVGIVGE